VSQAKTTFFAWRSYHLGQFDFKTLPAALHGETSFACACGAGGGTRRQSISTFSMSNALKRSFNMTKLLQRFVSEP
jgi:hypothetical protein